MLNIFWISIDRFDENISKAPRLEISESLINDNFSVTFLTGYRKEKYYPQDYQMKIRYFNSLHLSGLFKLSLNITIFLWLLKNAKLNDIIIMGPGNLWMGLFLKKIKKCKIHLDIRTVHVEVRGIKRKLNYFINWVMPLRLLRSYPESFSFITNRLKKNIEIEFNLTFRDYVLWQSGVNVDRFELVRKHTKSADHTFVLTYLGVITKSRGIDLVLKALAELQGDYKNKIILQIIGDGSFLSELVALSSALEISDRVIFNGYVAYESVPEYLKDADCFICPLPERPEWNVSSPIKIFEYLACGKPVILTPIVAHTDVMKNNEAIVWSKGDNVYDFVQAIKYAFDNRDELTTKSKKAYEFVKNNYSWKNQGRKFGGYLKEKYEN